MPVRKAGAVVWGVNSGAAKVLTEGDHAIGRCPAGCTLTSTLQVDNRHARVVHSRAQGIMAVWRHHERMRDTLNVEVSCMSWWVWYDITYK